ncbi:MAG: HAD hydrolase-like protein [Chloroflexi bacterium]|nr:HAD hydrolase-like protein [Chloroflexota bacterium]
MIKAVLLDLDNTLLRNDDRVFAAAYLRLVGEYLGQRWGHGDLSRVFLTAIRALAGTRDLQQTNTDLLLSTMCRETGISVWEIRTALEDFHREVYPSLGEQVRPIPQAAALVDELRRRQYAVAITTNPIYPAAAIQQRLTWAGLPDDFSVYALVTHADTMRLTKADPAFYAEVVARIGVEPDEAVMVGDSLKNDIQPAQQVGLSTYHIQSESSGATGPADAAGSLSDFFAAVRAGDWLDTLAPRPLTPEMIEPEMRGNLAALFGTLTDAKPRYWQQHPDPDEWSPLQIICHLLESERRVHRARLERILKENNPFLAEPPTPSGARATRICDDDGQNATRRFAIERLDTLAWLRTLRPDDWQRPARHSIFGLTTLLEMAHFTAQHDRLHINQLCQTLGRCQ